MQRAPQDDLRELFSLAETDPGASNQVTIRLKKRLAEESRAQLTVGTPTAQDEAGLRRLADQLRSGKLVVKLHTRHALHAKLYLLYRDDFNNPITGFLGSSNLTFSGLSGNGELNIDVLDHDATQKLSRWFDDRWDDRFCIDISAELVTIIEESWAREALVPPHHVYLKMAYHLSEEARLGLREFDIPRSFDLLPYQGAAVKLAAHHLNNLTVTKKFHGGTHVYIRNNLLTEQERCRYKATKQNTKEVFAQFNISEEPASAYLSPSSYSEINPYYVVCYLV